MHPSVYLAQGTINQSGPDPDPTISYLALSRVTPTNSIYQGQTAVIRVTRSGFANRRVQALVTLTAGGTGTAFTTFAVDMAAGVRTQDFNVVLKAVGSPGIPVADYFITLVLGSYVDCQELPPNAGSYTFNVLMPLVNPLVTVTLDSTTVDEGQTLTVRFTRLQTGGTSSVAWAATTPATSTDLQSPTSGTVNFGTNDTVKTVVITTKTIGTPGADKTITIALTSPTNCILNVTSLTATLQLPTDNGGLDWYKSEWVNGVSRYTGRPINVMPNFFDDSWYDDWVTQNKNYDGLDGVGIRAFKPQNWTDFIGGPGTSPTTLNADTWLHFNQSGHIYRWFRQDATARPRAWLVINCVCIPTMKRLKVRNPVTGVLEYPPLKITGAEQLQLIDDIVAGRKDDDLILLGKRMRYAIEHENGGTRAGCAHLVMLRVNWEFLGTTSLIVNGDDVLDALAARERSGTVEEKQIVARNTYRSLMAKWCRKVREGYSAGWTSGLPAVRLRVACSFSLYSHRGYPLQDLILNNDDYDLVDMMYHPDKVRATGYDALYNMFYQPKTSWPYKSGTYTHWDAQKCAELKGIAYGALETGPNWFKNDDGTQSYTDYRSATCPPDWAAASIGQYHYRIHQGRTYQCMVKGPGNSTVAPTHTTIGQEVTGSDGYKWKLRVNLGRKMSPYEFSDLIFANHFETSGRGAFIGSYRVESCNPNFINSDWPADQKNYNTFETMASDWRRFVQMRTRVFGGLL